MKLPIKKRYFDMIKEGRKSFEWREAHITFVCEETGETLTKEIDHCAIVRNEVAKSNNWGLGISNEEWETLFKEKNLIQFKLK